MGQIRAAHIQDNKGIKNTYKEDFAFLEVMGVEPETGIISDAINYAASNIDKPSK